MFIQTKGLVLREVTYKEADRIITVLTEKDGIVSAKARGALRKNSKYSAGTQMLTYSDFIFVSRDGKLSVSEANVIESFEGMRTDIAALSLGSYFAECTQALLVENQPDAEVLQLNLNCLYALSRKMYSNEKIKAAFELRIMSLSGYEPQLEGCADCGSDIPGKMRLSIADGCLYCPDCAMGRGMGVSAEEQNTMRFIVSAPAKKLLSFTTDDITAQALSFISEQYLQNHTERKFSTLDYYKKLSNFKV